MLPDSWLVFAEYYAADCAIPFTPTTFATKVAAALTQACMLDAIIDEALAALRPREVPREAQP